MSNMEAEVYITGVGLTKIHEHWNKSLKHLAFEAIDQCLKEVNYKRPDVIVVSNALGSFLQNQNSLSGLIAENISLIDIPNLKVEVGELSGAAALNVAYSFIKSGMYKNVLLVGVEKTSDKLPIEYNTAIASFLDNEYFTYNGITPSALYAIVYKLYMKKFGVKQEHIAQFASHDHKMAMNVDHSQYKFPLPVEKILSSPILADPIRLFESYPVSDGAAAIMLSSKDQVENKDYAVKLDYVSLSTDKSLLYRDDFLYFKSLHSSFERLKLASKIENKDIDFIEIHDSYTIASPLILESMGYTERGKGYVLLIEGQHEKDGVLPMNTHGGLKARGHPIGATAIYQVIEATLQLREKARNQVPNPEIGLVHSMSNIADQSALILLKR
jgi:acetyl-CoA C-acetyltransferase